MIRRRAASCCDRFAPDSREAVISRSSDSRTRPGTCRAASILMGIMNPPDGLVRKCQHEGHSLAFRAFLLLVGCLLAHMTGCGLFSPKRTVLYDGPRGSILLENVPQRGSTAGFRSVTGLQASHPIILEPSVIQASLGGLSLRRGTTAVPPTTDSPDVRPVFSREDAQFLAPLISTALSAATSDQYVIFRVLTSPGGSGSGQRGGDEIDSKQSPMRSTGQTETAGALYVQMRSLHIILTKYRGRLDTARAPDQTQADTRDLIGRTLLFTPTSAIRPELSRREMLPLPAELPSVAVDYQALPRTTEPPAPFPSPIVGAPESRMSAPVPPTAEEVRELKELVVKKDLELERMRDEIKQLKQELKDLAAQQRSSAGSRKQPPRAAPSTPKP